MSIDIPAWVHPFCGRPWTPARARHCPSRSSFVRSKLGTRRFDVSNGRPAHVAIRNKNPPTEPSGEVQRVVAGFPRNRPHFVGGIRRMVRVQACTAVERRVRHGAHRTSCSSIGAPCHITWFAVRPLTPRLSGSCIAAPSSLACRHGRFPDTFFTMAPAAIDE